MEEKDLTKLEKASNENMGKKSTLIKVLSFCAYIGIGCIAIALILSAIFKGKGGNVQQVFRSIGEVIAYVIAIILAFNFVKTKKHMAWLVCYIVFVVTIVVLYILVVI